MVRSVNCSCSFSGPDNGADAAAVPGPPGPVGADAVAEGLNPPPAEDGEDVAEIAAEMEAELAAEVEARVGDAFHWALALCAS